MSYRLTSAGTELVRKGVSSKWYGHLDFSILDYLGEEVGNEWHYSGEGKMGSPYDSVSIGGLVRYTGGEASTVKRSLKNLERQGLVEEVKGKNVSNY